MDEYVFPPQVPPDPDPDPVPAPAPTRSLLGRVPGAVQTSVLVGVGLVAGLVGVAALRGGGPEAVPASASSSAQVPQGAARVPRDAGQVPQGTTQVPAAPAAPDGAGAVGGLGGLGGLGGVGGETRLVGTLTRVGSDTVTVRTADGTTTTVPVAAGTQVLEDGVVAGLADLDAGEQVVVHVLPDGDGTVAERVLAGSSALEGPGRRGGRRGPGSGDQQDRGTPGVAA
ncbi:MAG: hypothetical protein JWM64_1021 [Frankiales bacterium]|nr:hypothetical protein [Frankiales bacterium]